MKSKGNIGFMLAFVLIFLLSFSSCSTEQKLAREAGEYVDKANLLILFPDEMFLLNSKSYNYPDSLTDDELYRASIDSSFFLNDADTDSIFMEFQKSILSLYESYGFTVYQKENLDSFLTVKTTAFVIEFTQLQLEEFYKPFHEEEEMEDGYFYTKNLILNALGVDAWITVSKLNDSLGSQRLIYSEASISDEIDGFFTMAYVSGKVSYNYSFKPLEVEDSYDIVDESSIKISLDVIDFIANTYIEKNMLRLTDEYPHRLWRYNPGRTKLTPVEGKSDYIIIE